MKMHANARLSLKGRELLVDRVENAGWSLSAAAEAAGISDRTARKWQARYRTEGPDGLVDRSSAPRRVANRTDDARVEVIAALRRLRLTGAEIAECLDMALSTVSGILTSIGLGKLGRLGLEPAQRYERARPGELIHIDVKKLGGIHDGAGYRLTGRRGRYTGQRTDAEGRERKIVGWEYVHVCIDDATRLAYVEVLADEKAITAVAFLRRAVKHDASYGITTERLITDSGSAYRSAVHAIACRALGIRHLRTRPYRPQTNALAESFVDSYKTELIADRVWRSRAQLELATVEWVGWFNHQRLHEALGDIPPTEFEALHRAAAGSFSDDPSVAGISPRAAQRLTPRPISSVTVNSGHRLKSRVKGDLARTTPAAAAVQELAAGLYDE